MRLLAKLIASKSVLNFTHVEIGTGILPRGFDPASMVGLVEYKMNGIITRCKAENDLAQLTMQVSSVGVETGFTMTELGVYADDPDLGEILYAYLDMAEDSQYIYAQGGQAQKFLDITLEIAIDQATKVTAWINPNGLVTIEMFDERNTILAEQIQLLTTQIDYLFQLMVSCKYDTDYELVDLGFRCAIDGETVLMAPQMGNWDSESEMLMLTNQGIPSIDGVIPGAGIGYGLQPATPQRLGGVKIGQGLDIDSDGTISVNVETSAEKAAALVEANMQEFSNEEIQSLFTDGLTPLA